jgi:hypothetical protein
MTRPEVADVFREFEPAFLDQYGQKLLPQQRRVFSDILACRTAALGSHRRRCDACGHEEISYNSCRNRHCPKCQGTKRREWLEREAAHLIDTEYFHVVFTLPENLGPLALCNQRLVYGSLFEAAADAIATIARDPQHLGATPGFTAVLHTWGQTLEYHPHLHCVVPGGGLSPDGSRWIPCRPGFFLPVRVLSRRFREVFIRLLERKHELGKLAFSESTASIEQHWTDFIGALRDHEWVVYAKPPFGGPEQVLKYLANYTHRVAISNSRVVAIEGDRVRFRWKDYRSSRKRTMSLAGPEFIRRFLMHVLPPRFVRIRHYGFLANCVRETRIERIRELLEPPAMPEIIATEAGVEPGVIIEIDDTDRDPPCPRCKKGRLRVIELYLPDARSPWPG